jgi:hypothetical protein
MGAVGHHQRRLLERTGRLNVGESDERADFFERDTGYRKRSVAIRTNWAEMRIAENAWRRFATAANRAGLRFRVHGGASAD